MSKKQVLIFLDWFHPAFEAGGPIQSIRNLINRLDNKYEFLVVTSNSDLNTKLDIENSNLNKWIVKDNFKVIYLTKSRLGLFKIFQIIKKSNSNFIYLNSLFSRKFSLFPLIFAKILNIKVILAPRGMLGKGALNLKRKKKLLYLKIFRILNLGNIYKWHATDSVEKNDILNFFGAKSSVQVAPNFSKIIPNKLNFKYKEKNHINLFFISRISKKKNLLKVYEILKKVDKNLNLSLSIVGPIDDQFYWDKCHESFQKLKNNNKSFNFKYFGAIPNASLTEIFSRNHILLLPTLHENFGHVIVESFQNGCPVIISDQTPWTNLKDKNVGFDISLNEENKFVDAVEFFGFMNQDDFNGWSQSAYDFISSFVDDPNLYDKYIKLFS